jgi:hypothetical protein
LTSASIGASPACASHRPSSLWIAVRSSICIAHDLHCGELAQARIVKNWLTNAATPVVPA